MCYCLAITVGIVLIIILTIKIIISLFLFVFIYLLTFNLTGIIRKKIKVSLSRTLTHTRSFQFCWRLKLTLEVSAGLRLVTSPCCLSPCVCTCRFPPPHSLLVSSWRLFMVCPPHSCSAQDGGPGSQYRASRAGLGSPWSTSLLPPLPVPRGLRPSSYWGLLESSPWSSLPLHHQSRDGSLCITQTSAPSTFPAGGLP